MTAAGPGAGPSAAKSAEPIDLLSLEPVGPGRYQVPMPAGSPEGAQVVFGGQLMAQMIMAAAASVGEAKYVKSMHTIFTRAGSHAQPIQGEAGPSPSRRTWAPHTSPPRH